MTKEFIFGILLGMAVGGGVFGFTAYSLTKRKYISILRENTDNYEKLLKEMSENVEDDIPDEYKRYIPKEEKESDMPRISKDEKEIIKEKLRYNHEKTTAYANMYNKPKDIIEAQLDEQTEAGEPVEDPEEEVTNIFEASQKASNRKPVIISEEHYEEFVNGSSAWDVEDLFLYNDGVITNAEDKVIDGEELEVMLGDCLDKYGFRDSNEKMIYIQCFKLSTVYSIQKFEKPFIP